MVLTYRIEEPDIIYEFIRFRQSGNEIKIFTERHPMEIKGVRLSSEDSSHGNATAEGPYLNLVFENSRLGTLAGVILCWLPLAKRTRAACYKQIFEDDGRPRHSYLGSEPYTTRRM